MDEDQSTWSPSAHVKSDSAGDHGANGVKTHHGRAGLPPNMKFNKQKSYNDPAQMFPGSIRIKIVIFIT